LNERGGDVALSLFGRRLITLLRSPGCRCLTRIHATVFLDQRLSRACERPFLRERELPYAAPGRCGPCRENQSRRLIMKTIVSALLALTVLTGVAIAPASAAWDTKAFWDNLERTQGGGGN
jgi:hypothetical protein